MMRWDKTYKPGRLDIEVADVCQLERHQLLFVLRPSRPVSAGTRRPATGHIIACDKERMQGAVLGVRIAWYVHVRDHPSLSSHPTD